ncbi:toprim domain-containing protein [Calycomorphotria hydatis]|uniref:DNA primase n=1 Tax=Calycomorphotria hydatis TaxID=2528027 RepID=A0A517T6T6_9PLAN|nr:hypothetical protein [Calycomorphotria hydatis]QDT64083.1 DNA primase [Calycomorphotria hydatis]
MRNKKSAYMHDVDELIARTSLNQVLEHYSLPPAEKSSGEHRMECVFSDECANSNYGQMTVKVDDPAHRIYCHSCGIRGSLLMLIHGLEHHTPPTGGQLRGNEFKNAVSKLREIAGAVHEQVQTVIHEATTQPPQDKQQQPINTPLIRHDKEAARALANLHEELIVDVAEMSPQAAAYVRSRPWMTPELLRKWGVGWIPGNGRSLFRKNYLVYTHRNERGEVVSYSGRDLQFEEKRTTWLRHGQEGDKKPNKHRYVSGYHRGLELYGGEASRLQEDYVRPSLQKYGVVVVEGMNEVLRMETLRVAAVGLGSNKATEAQIEKLTRFAHTMANNRVLLLPDCDEEGEAGFKELLWKLTEQGLHVRLGSSSTMHDGKFTGRQPESFTDEEWTIIAAHLV